MKLTLKLGLGGVGDNRGTANGKISHSPGEIGYQAFVSCLQGFSDEKFAEPEKAVIFACRKFTRSASAGLH